MHTVTLLVNAKVRNKWINDLLLHVRTFVPPSSPPHAPSISFCRRNQARLMSLTPLPVQNAFTMIHKSRVPEAAKRGRLFESAITRLAEWWAGSFEVTPTGHIRSRAFEEVQKTLPPPKAPAPSDPKGKGKARAVEEDDEDDEERYGVEGERIRSEKSLMKHALMRRGSRDTSAQLFTALCRALGIPARLVVSLQSVPWQAGVGKPKHTTKKKAKPEETDAGTNGKGKGKGKEKASEVEDEGDMEDVTIPGTPSAGSSRGRSAFPGNGQRLSGPTPALSDTGKQKAAPVIRLRKSKGGQKLGSTASLETARPRPRRSPHNSVHPCVHANRSCLSLISQENVLPIPRRPHQCFGRRCSRARMRSGYPSTPYASS